MAETIDASVEPLLHREVEDGTIGTEYRFPHWEDDQFCFQVGDDDDKSEANTDIHLIEDIPSMVKRRFSRVMSLPTHLKSTTTGIKFPPESGETGIHRLEGSSTEVKRFQTSLRILNLDHSRSFWGFLSWTVGLLFIVIVPTLRFLYVYPAHDDQLGPQLPFRFLVFVLEGLLSGVSFLCFHHMIRKHGHRGVLFLDAAHDEPYKIRQAYDKGLKHVTTLLFKMFCPAFALHFVQKLLIYTMVPLAPFPITFGHRKIELGVVFIITSAAWMFQTTTFLFVCVVFWKICSLQVLTMKHYSSQLQKYDDPCTLFYEYSRIIEGLGIISHRFRGFLSLSGIIIVLGSLASMYNVVQARKGNITFLNTGELAVCNWLYLLGGGLCLRSASRIAHQHRRIVKQACTMHARSTYGVESVSQCSTPTGNCQAAKPISMVGVSIDSPNDSALARIEAALQRQEASSQRAALVGFLSQTTAGISIYGFVLDRAFIHTSFGALCTTTWFILGRSLGA